MDVRTRQVYKREGLGPWMRMWPVVCGLVLILGISDVHSHRALPDTQEKIQWLEWGEPAFQKAQTEEKLILLDLTAIWCHACHVMDETTYANPEIAAILNASFVPIKVDTDQHPDIEARYRAGGWPTTSLLLPTGEILFQANSLDPPEMKALLNEAQDLYRDHKDELSKQAQSLWKKVQEAAHPPDQGLGLAPSLVDQTVAFMKNQFDEDHGGFRSAPKFFEPEAIHTALALGFFKDDPQLTHMGLYTLERQSVLLDPVWGGFYRYAEQGDWTEPHFEKMLTIQAGNLANYLEAYQLTGKKSYRLTAEAIVDYVWEFLTDHERAQFWESQDADLRSSEGVTLIEGGEFFRLSGTDRSLRGHPSIDRRVFTGSNAWMAEVLIHASWVLERPAIRGVALKVLKHLIDDRWVEGRGVWHGGDRHDHGTRGLLSDYLHLGRALVSAYQSTGEEAYLQAGEALAKEAQAFLEDPQKGGFFDRVPDQKRLGLLKMPLKSSIDNLQVALWYLDLYHLTRNKDYREVTERTLLSVMSSQDPLPIALVGKAIDRWYRENIHVAVVGRRTDSRTTELVEKGMHLYYPGKLLRLFDPGEGPPIWGDITFPYDGRPVAFACTERLCSPPVYSPENLESNFQSLFSNNKDREIS